ncbi:MAG: zf-HC2 domain-containing protein [Acidobacteria bacterium]|nr:zf-HC2 domain-containing protein [Acidobacteriota bacterium]
MHTSMHIPDHELVQWLDGELAAVRARQVRAHLAECPQCANRLSEMQAAAEAFTHLHHDAMDPRIDMSAGPAAKLRAAMAEIQSTERGDFWRSHRYAVPTVAAALLIAATVYWTAAKPAPNPALPNASLTPGATRMMSRQQVCAANIRDDDHVMPAHLAPVVFRSYGIQPKPGDYEVDYLINPALGGADDTRNLWPQPYGETIWTARVKDALEEHLRELVCNGTLDLATAQHDIASNWITAYRKYFRTAVPLPAHALFMKDKPWITPTAE